MRWNHKTRSQDFFSKISFGLLSSLTCLLNRKKCSKLHLFFSLYLKKLLIIVKFSKKNLLETFLTEDCLIFFYCLFHLMTSCIYTADYTFVRPRGIEDILFQGHIVSTILRCDCTDYEIIFTLFFLSVGYIFLFANFFEYLIDIQWFSNRGKKVDEKL